MSQQSNLINPKGQPSFVVLASVISALYLSQGLPSGFIAHALPAFLREQGQSLALIGALKLLALPWLLKFIWAPWVEGSGSLNRRSGWIFTMQIFAALALLGLSFWIQQGASQAVIIALLCLLMVNLASATQDIATDGLTASYTDKDKLGLANSIQVTGYKIGMLIGGSGLLYISQYLTVPELLNGMAVLLTVLLIPLLIFRYRYQTKEQPSSVTTALHQSRPAQYFQIYKGFFTQASIKSWLLVLLTYKLSDAMGSAMIKPLLIDNHLSLAEVGELTFYANLSGLVGAVLAGVIYRFWGKGPSLLLFGLLQTISISSFYFIDQYELSRVLLSALVLFEQFSDGLSTVVLFAAMMSHCRVHHEGSDYTLQASMQILLAGILGVISGLVADMFGYAAVYVLCAVCGFIALLCVLNYQRNLACTS